MPAFDKPINTKVMNALAKAIADVGRVMGMDIVPDKYTEPVMELEPDVVRFLAAQLPGVAEDYGKPLPWSSTSSARAGPHRHHGRPHPVGRGLQV